MFMIVAALVSSTALAGELHPDASMGGHTTRVVFGYAMGCEPQELGYVDENGEWDITIEQGVDDDAVWVKLEVRHTWVEDHPL